MSQTCGICNISPSGPAPKLIMSMTLCRVLIKDECTTVSTICFPIDL